jgi:hypothetical protein
MPVVTLDCARQRLNIKRAHTKQKRARILFDVHLFYIIDFMG